MEPRIYFSYLKQDDPRKSTMKKLEKFGLAVNVPIQKGSRSLSLTPYSDSALLPRDRDIVLRSGLFTLDGSWNRISTVKDLKLRYPRRLPMLVPVNPVNFGKPGKLSSVEALAGALHIMGFQEVASLALSKFNWGSNFLVVNAEPLAAYSQCGSQEDMERAESEFF